MSSLSEERKQKEVQVAEKLQVLEGVVGNYKMMIEKALGELEKARKAKTVVQQELERMKESLESKSREAEKKEEELAELKPTDPSAQPALTL